MSEASPQTRSAHPLLAVWQQHVYAEFVSKDVEAALATMTEDTHVLLVPVATGGHGKEAVRSFYATSLIPQLPPDIRETLISQTIGSDCLVEEAVYTFTHTLPMDWMLPGVAPTGRRVEVAVVGLIQFRAGKIAAEHLYWDQASVLVQLGLLEVHTLPVLGAESARKVLSYLDA
jgi:carboxymethylenebutenolidase